MNQILSDFINLIHMYPLNSFEDDQANKADICLRLGLFETGHMHSKLIFELQEVIFQ